MGDFSEYSEDFYNNIYESYKSEDYFDEIVITINYSRNLIPKKGNDRLYKIDSLSLEDSQLSAPSSELKSFINNCNDALIQNACPNDWQLFYLYKELFQFFIGDDDNNCNYFRGQCHSYELVPGILRKSIQNSYRRDFENVYLKISNEFPDKVSYFDLKSLENIENREYQLSLLQHYGLKTSLLDITKNPYIAMLFMLSDSFLKYKEPTLFLFKINESTHRYKHLFTEVKKSKLNERIIAQKGAFLNFDKIFTSKSSSISKIPSIKIVLHFDKEKYIKEINDEKIKIASIIAQNPSREEDFASYRDTLDKEEKEIKESKVRCLQAIKCELSKKLREYYYFEEDLFPDFEKRIQYLSSKYESTITKKISPEVS